MEIYKLYCGGEFIEGEPLDVTEKYTGEVFAKASRANAQILDKAILAANSAKKDCAALSSFEKARAISFIADEIEKNQKHHAQVLAMESGKPMVYASTEAGRAVQTFRIAAEECKRLPREYMSLDWTEAGKGTEGFVKHFPAGVVAGISPFNFPLNLAVHKIAPAIAAGCPIILKPASATPLSTLLLARVVAQAGLPPGAVSILPMDRKTGNLLVTDERIQVLSFTGSPVVGWELKKQAGKKKVVLELGGNAGVIVTASADINAIMDRCVTGGFSYSGQICIHAQRFYVHDSVFDSFVKLFLEKASQLKNGNPLDESTRMSVMIDLENAERVEQWIAEAAKSGAKILLGGKRSERYVEPTVLTNTTTSMKANGEEVFGPVVCIEKYSGHVRNAVDQINDTRFGLQCGLFTDTVTELRYAFQHLEVGGVIHNDVPTLRYDQMPYGGVKDSGLGREGVRYAIMDMMEPRILVSRTM